MRHVVCGAAGMIGSHLVRSLLDDGEEVRAVDIEPIDRWQMIDGRADNIARCDLMVLDNAMSVCDSMDQVWDLAFLMGGIGYITEFPFECITSSRIAANLLHAAMTNGHRRFFYSSSACVYSQQYQRDPAVRALAETMVHPVDPEFGYGTAKWFDEEQCAAAYEQCQLETRVARYHNIYSGGPTTWTGGKEKAPAALCRKVATAVATGDHTVEVWGDGKATRTYCWIDDCVEGTRRLMDSDVRQPVNIGSTELISSDGLALLIADIAGIDIEIVHDLSGAEGVRGRSSDNTLCEATLGWAPSTPLRDGIERLYRWIEPRVFDTVP